MSEKDSDTASSLEVRQGALDGLIAGDVSQADVGRLGVDLFNRLYALMRNIMFFNLNNEALDHPVKLFLTKLGELGECQVTEASVTVTGEDIFLNHQLLKPDRKTHENSHFIAMVFKKLEVEEFQFDTKCTEEDLRAFMSALKAVLKDEKDRSVLLSLKSFKMVSQVGHAGKQEAELDSRFRSARTFVGAIARTTRLMEMAAEGVDWNPSAVRRVAYDLCDAAGSDPNLLLGLLNLYVGQTRLGSHLVRVAVLAILAARKMGLPPKATSEAALVALLHHMMSPKEESYLSVEGLQKEGFQPSRLEPLDAVLPLFSRRYLNEGLIRLVVRLYEVSCAVGRPGRLYQVVPSGRTGLLGGIVTVSDRYATLSETLQPDLALRELLFERKASVPTLCRYFVHTVGLYPVGTVVDLKSGARAVVAEAPRTSQHFLRPVVRTIDATGSVLVDLSQESDGYGMIRGTVDARKAGINVSSVFLQ